MGPQAVPESPKPQQSCNEHRVDRKATVDDINPALPYKPYTMGIMVYSYYG